MWNVEQPAVQRGVAARMQAGGVHGGPLDADRSRPGPAAAGERVGAGGEREVGARGGAEDPARGAPAAAELERPGLRGGRALVFERNGDGDRFFGVGRLEGAGVQNAGGAAAVVEDRGHATEAAARWFDRIVVERPGVLQLRTVFHPDRAVLRACARSGRERALVEQRRTVEHQPEAPFTERAGRRRAHGQLPGAADRRRSRTDAIEGGADVQLPREAPVCRRPASAS